MIDREELISAYAERLVEDMPYKELVALVEELLGAYYAYAADEEVLEEIGERYPELIETEEGETDDDE